MCANFCANKTGYGRSLNPVFIFYFQWRILYNNSLLRLSLDSNSGPFDFLLFSTIIESKWHAISHLFSLLYLDCNILLGLFQSMMPHTKAGFSENHGLFRMYMQIKNDAVKFHNNYNHKLNLLFTV